VPISATKFSDEIHIGLLSTSFIKDSNSELLVAPIVSFYVVKNYEKNPEHEFQLVPKTPLSDQFLSLILGYIGIFQNT